MSYELFLIVNERMLKRNNPIFTFYIFLYKSLGYSCTQNSYKTVFSKNVSITKSFNEIFIIKLFNFSGMFLVSGVRF